MKSKVIICVMGLLLILAGFVSLSEASQVPKVDSAAQIQAKPKILMGGAKPIPKIGVVAEESKIQILSPQLKAKGFMSINMNKLSTIQNQFEAANPNDYDGDGIPNDVDVVCQESPKQIVMLAKADMPSFNDYVYTVDTDQNLSSDVTVGNFLLRYISFSNELATLRSYYNPNQVDSGMTGYNCLWPSTGDAYADVFVGQEFTKLNTLCGSHLVRLIYHDPATDNVILQFIKLTQIPEACMHPDPGPYEGDVAAFQQEIETRMNLPECQNLRYPRDRFSHMSYQEARQNNYPVGCHIDYPIAPYTGPTVGPCHPAKSCREVSGSCAAAGLPGDCSDLDNCCGQPIVK